MSTRLPQSTTGWKVAQNSDKYGDIVRTRNLDFTESGFITLARKAIGLFSKNESTNFGVPLCITNDAVFYYILTTTGLFQYNTTTQVIQQINIPTDQPTFSFQSDMCIFNKKVAATGTTTSNDYDPSNNTWTHPVRVTGLSSAYPHPIESFITLAYICVGDGNLVKMYDLSYNLIATLTLEAGYIVTKLVHLPGYMYIATRNIEGRNARLFVWPGTFDGSANGTGAVSYDAGGDWIYSMDEYDSSVAIVNSLGQLRRFNGGGFDELDAFPVYYTDYSWISSSAVSNLIGKIASRGMRAIGKRIIINIDGTVSLNNNQYPGKNLPNQPSGVWVYDPTIGLTHRAGYVHESHQAVAVTAVNSNFLLLAAAVDLQIGDAVTFPTLSGLTGIVSTQTYFAIPASTTTTQLALSPYDAKNGVVVPIGGTPSGSDVLHVEKYSSVGATLVNNPGPVHPIATLLPDIFFADEFLFGGEAIDGTGAAIGMLMSLGMGRNVGSFVTSRMPASQLTDKFNKLFAKLEPFYLATHSITMKFRKAKRFGIPMSTSGPVTWTGANSFTINIHSRDFSAAQPGDEIEVIQGAGSGYTAHILTINTDASPTYAVTLDSNIPGAMNGQIFDFTIDNWTKLETFALDSKGIPEGTLETAVGEDSTWVQGKVEFAGFKVKMDEMDIPSTPDMNFN